MRHGIALMDNAKLRLAIARWANSFALPVATGYGLYWLFLEAQERAGGKGFCESAVGAVAFDGGVGEETTARLLDSLIEQEEIHVRTNEQLKSFSAGWLLADTERYEATCAAKGKGRRRKGSYDQHMINISSTYDHDMMNISSRDHHDIFPPHPLSDQDIINNNINNINNITSNITNNTSKVDNTKDTLLSNSKSRAKSLVSGNDISELPIEGDLAKFDTAEVRQALVAWVEFKLSRKEGYKSLAPLKAMLRVAVKERCSAELFCHAVDYAISHNWMGVHFVPSVRESFAGHRTPQESAPSPAHTSAQSTPYKPKVLAVRGLSCTSSK